MIKDLIAPKGDDVTPPPSPSPLQLANKVIWAHQPIQRQRLKHARETALCGASAATASETLGSG